MTLSTAKWIYGLGAAFIGGGAAAVTAGLSANLIAPHDFNLTDGLGKLLMLTITSFIVQGMFHAFGYLAKSPLPTFEDESKARAANQNP